MKRALEKMASWFGKKGVALSVAGLTPVLSTEMRKAAPVGLVMANGVELGRVGSSWGEVRELALLSNGMLPASFCGWRDL
jgi:hypothetical protein